MSFYERYEKICIERGIDPCSQRAAEMLKTTRAAISTWKSKGTTPKGESILLAAEALNVSTDYLLGRTEDPTDWSNPKVRSCLKNSKDASTDDVKREKGRPPKIISRYDLLDGADRTRVEAYIDGLLTKDKYAEDEKKNA